MIRFLTALALLFAIPAFAQQPIPIGGGGGSGGSPCYYPVGSSCTFSLGVNVTGATGYSLGGITILNAVGTNGASTIGGLNSGINLPSTDTESTAYGYRALNAQATATAENTAIGWESQTLTNGGEFDTTVGVNTLGANVTGSSLTCVGTDCMRDVTTATHSTGMGVAALRDWNCEFCIAIGENALRGAADGSSTGSSNTAIGYDAFDTTAATSSASSNTVVGANAGGTAVTSANQNSCVGFNACNALTSGSKNAVLGADAGKTISTAASNSLFGYSAGNAENSNNNTMVGYQAGLVATGGNETFIGEDAGSTVSTGGSNLCIGQGACSTTLATGADNIVIGITSAADTPLAATNSYFGIFGNSSTAFISAAGINAPTTETLTLHGSSVLLPDLGSDTGKSDATVCDVTASGTLYYGSGTGGICLSTSTARFKDNIEATLGGAASAFIAINSFMRLDTVAWNYKPGHGFDPSHRYWGWTAEQMENVYPALVGHDEQGRPNSVDMMGVLPRAVNAIQVEEYEIIGLAFVCLILAGWCAMLQREAAKTRKRLRAIEARIV